MVGRKGLEPSQIARLVPNASASVKLGALYIIELICPIRIIV